VLETIRTVLEALAGPEHVHAGTEGALAALTDVLGAEAAAVRVVAASGAEGPVTLAAVGAGGGRQDALLTATADAVLAGGDTAQAGGGAGHVLAVPLDLPDGRAALAVLWQDAAATEGGAEVLRAGLPHRRLRFHPARRGPHPLVVALLLHSRRGGGPCRSPR
jgi:hypothetical protein